MSSTIFKYPLDLLGTSINNKVIDEAHTIGSSRARLFASDYGPFFGNSVVLHDGVTGRELIVGTDYKLRHPYREARERTGQAVYAVVQITNPEVSTKILFTAQLVGGEFSFSTFAIRQAIEEIVNDDRPVFWGDLVGVPSQFVPAPHLHSAYDLYGMKYVVEAQYDIAAAIREGDVGSRELLLGQIKERFDIMQRLYDAMTANAKLIVDEYIQLAPGASKDFDLRALVSGDPDNYRYLDAGVTARVKNPSSTSPTSGKYIDFPGALTVALTPEGILTIVNYYTTTLDIYVGVRVPRLVFMPVTP